MRWKIENTAQEIERSLRSETNTLVCVGLALFGFAIAVLTYYARSVIKAAITCE